MIETKKEDWAVKNVKTFFGMEGQGFNCALYLHNRKVAKVIDDARGGIFLYEWKDSQAESILNAYCAAQPTVRSEEHDFEYSLTPDIFVDDLVTEFLEIKQLKGWCRNRIVWREEGQEEGAYMRTKTGVKFTKVNVEAVKKMVAKEGKKIAEIINARFNVPA